MKVANFPSPDPGIIRHDAGNLPQIADATARAVAAADNGIFQRGGALVRLYHNKEKQARDPVNRETGTITLVQVSPIHFAEVATRCAIHSKFDGRTGADKVIDCPIKVANAYVARGHYPEFPELHSITLAPTVAPDGRVIDKPGYDKNSKLFLAINRPLPKCKTGKLGRSATQDAFQYLAKHFSSFPFRSQADLAAALAMLIGGLLRPVLPAAPLGVVSAPTAGTGKSLVTEAIGIIGTGKRPPVMSIGTDETETEKRIQAALLAGDSMLVIDNVSRPVGNEDVLCQLATAPALRFRPLGASAVVSVPTTCSVLMTGNNLAIVGDLKRRVIVSTLDAGIERPEQRVFQNDFLADTLAARWDLIAAAFSVVTGYLKAGCPDVGTKAFGSFADWDRMVRRSLIYAGAADPLDAAEELRANDPDLEAMRLLFAAWHEAVDNQATTVASIIEKANSSCMGQYHKPELHEALLLITGEKITGRRVGGWLRRHRDRIIDGLQLQQVEGHGRLNVAQWRITRV
jgi:putative DNA primase/helicase